jgi:hypothetical protein
VVRQGVLDVHCKALAGAPGAESQKPASDLGTLGVMASLRKTLASAH